MFSYKEIYKELNLIKHDGRIAYANNMVEKLSTIDKEFKHHFDNIIQKIKDENITRI
jgi:tRNA isopentenyl-2-thiomethyl-A-37 hydroxylase MiaE